MITGENKVKHQSVLLQEVVNFLAIEPGERYIDATVGSGGHAVEIIKQGGRVLGLDRDPQAIRRARKVLRAACPAPHHKDGEGLPFKLVRSNFVHLEKVAKKSGFLEVSGVVFDLGFSSEQMEDSYRGFSFARDEPLDMRMDPDGLLTAKDIINNFGQRRLYELFTKLAEEPRARAIARAVVSARDVEPIKTTYQLKSLIEEVYGRDKVGRLHVATKVFQALRIVVNQELECLEIALPQVIKILRPGGRLVVISFHSGEDRVVKNFFRQVGREGGWRILTKKPIRPDKREININPRSRSARLRVGEVVN